ncbi:MAG: alcohol dehydrogenase catalytic domain-containing protein, partial [Myxococcales bacterium]|nr:alcohol dehydrogenase catalytic domain-containing protein [Myxococcales bacterium]
MNAIREVDGRLAWVGFPTPEPGPGEVRIRVRATAVNRADLVQRAGHYPPPPGAPDTLGLECAGVIDAIGPDVTGRAVGDEVVALLAGGGYAEQVCCPASHTLPRPSGLSWAESAAVMEVFATAATNLLVKGGLVAG